MRQIKLNRQKLGVEDLLFGTGTEEQTRGNQQAIVTKINAGNLPFDETRSLSEFAQQVNLEQLGNAITELLNINANLSGLLNIDPYQFNKIGFKTNINETVATGQVAWNQQESTIDVGLNSEVTLQVGQEELVLVKNSTGTTITNGKVVMVVGSNGNSGNLLVALHDGTKAKAIQTLGITTQDIANDASGFVTKSGKVRGINTSGSTFGETWVDGDVLYVSTNGNLTKVVPSDTALKMAIAVVINAHGSNGTLFVRTNGLDENHDKDWVNTSLTLKANTTDLKEIGVGQTWQDVTASRSKYITYTNTTNKPIFVSIRLNFGTSNVGVVLRVGSVVASAISGSNFETMFDTIVPPGYTYSLDNVGGVQESLSISSWSELR